MTNSRNSKTTKSTQNQKTISNDNQIKRAKEYTNKLVDLVIAAESANENMRHAVYSSQLAKQIPRSYAAHAFKDLQRALLQFSVIRVCSLFDKKGKGNDRITLHTVLNDISDDDTISEIAEETYSSYANEVMPDSSYTEDDAELKKLIADHFKKSSEIRGCKEKELVHRSVNAAKKIVDRAERLFIEDHLRPFRNKYIAHNLSDNIENGRKIKFILGMENSALRHAKCAVNLLHLALNGIHFDWKGVEEVQQRNASEFWENLNFELPKSK